MTEQPPVIEWAYRQTFPPLLFTDEPMRKVHFERCKDQAIADAKAAGVTVVGEPEEHVTWMHEVLVYDSETRHWYVEDAFQVDTPEQANKGVLHYTWKTVEHDG